MIGRWFSLLEGLYVRSPIDILQQPHDKTPFVILLVLSGTRLKRLYVEFRTSSLGQSASVALSLCDVVENDWKRVAVKLVQSKALYFSYSPYVGQDRQLVLHGRVVRPRATLRFLLHLLKTPTRTFRPWTLPPLERQTHCSVDVELLDGVLLALARRRG